MDLTVLIEPRLDLVRLSQVLDEMGHEGRAHTLRTWGKKQQAALFEGAAGFRKIGLDQFVPPGTAPLVEVIHELHNSLPLFVNSQKRFCKAAPEGGSEPPGLLWGYNHQPWVAFTGPGYFVAAKSEVEGEVLFDYTRLPTSKPEGWPAIQPNSVRGGLLGGVTYGGMIDIVRALSTHVCIGRAKRGGKLAGMYFTLCRKDPG